MRLKDFFMPAAAFLVIVIMVWNELNTDEEHQEFFTDVRTFISKGGRNTAQDGYDLCMKLNVVIDSLENKNISKFDCDAKYDIPDEPPDD